MPTCEPCGTYYNPNTLGEDGTCPTCGEAVTMGELATHDHDEPTPHVPWHFWVGVFAVTAYLGWRLVQGILLLF